MFLLNKNWWDLLGAMTEKEIKARYKRTFFGFLWVFLNPLLQMLVIGAIFQFLVNFKINNYYLYLFIGLLIWDNFSISLNKCTPIYVYERNLLKKAKFAREVLPLSIILSNMFHLLVAFSLLLPLLAYFKTITLGHLLLFPLAIIWLLLTTIGFVLFLSSYNVRYRDVNFFVQAGLTLLFYATPVIYPLNILPAPFSILIGLNPITGVLMLTRYSLLAGEQLSSVLLISGGLVTIFWLVVGIVIFKKENQFFDDWL